MTRVAGAPFGKAAPPPGAGRLRVGVVVGSQRPQSINRKLAAAIVRLSPDGVDFRFLDCFDLPFFHQDTVTYPAPVAELHERILEMDAFLFVTPELNRSVPAALKNMLDWGSRRGNRWAGKPAAIVGASVGALGTAPAQAHLRNVLSYLDMPLLNQPEVYIHFRPGLIDDDGKITVEGTESFVRTFAERFHAWVFAMSPAAKAADAAERQEA